MLTMEQVLELVPVGKSTLKRMIKNGEFPSAHYISPKKMVWYEDFDHAVAGKPASREPPQARRAAQAGMSASWGHTI